MNDRFQGIPALIDSNLQKLAKNHALERATSLAMLELLMMFMKLSEGERQDIIGHVPDVDVDIVDPSAVGALLFNLANHASAKLAFLHGTAPDFEEKIKFNGLTPPVSFRLQRASYQVGLVDEFLTEHDLGLRQAIAHDIKGFYEKSKEEIPDTVDDAANERYTRMIELLIPDTPQHPHSRVAYVTAAEAILAKYFETCDAYEHPAGTPPAQTHSLQ